MKKLIPFCLLLNVCFVNAQTTLIPDSNFEQVLIDQGIDSDGVINGEVLTSDINTLTDLNVEDSNITDLTGIEGFSNLEKLFANLNPVATFNVSNNLLLKEIYLKSGTLTSVDLFNNSVLEVLNLKNNQLTTIDLSNNLALKNLNLSENALIELDVRVNSALTRFIASDNNLSLLNIKNGTNRRIANPENFNTRGNPTLTCIQVDNASFSRNVWRNVNAQTSFNEFCPELNTFVPDDNFEQRLIGLGYDDVLDNHVLTSNINNITNLNVSNRGITDATGLEDFTALEVLNINDNALTVLDISANINLRVLNCVTNQLNVLDTSTNTVLENLTCHNNPLTSIDISNNGALKVLGANLTNITSLDLRNNPNLENLHLNNNQNLSSLNIKNGNNTNINMFRALINPNLTCIQVDDENGSYLNSWEKDATTNYSELCPDLNTYVPDDNFEQALINLGYDDMLDDHVLTGNINTVTSLYLPNRNITDATGIEGFTALSILNLIGNNLTTINLAFNTSLRNLDLSDNNLTALDISNNLALESLDMSDNNLTALDISNILSLTNLRMPNNNLTSINLTNNTSLQAINLAENALTELDVSANSELDALVVLNNNLSSLNVKNGANTLIASSGSFYAIGNPNLTCIQVDDVTYSTATWTNIDSQTSFNEFCPEFSTYVPDDNFEQALIDLGYDSVLDDYVYTESINTINSLNISNKNIIDLTGLADFVNLTNLNVSNNPLGSLDLSTNNRLNTLSASNCQLSTIDLSNSEQLSVIVLGNNNLSTINLLNNMPLEVLTLTNNPLSSLNVSNYTDLRILHLDDTDLTTIDVSNNTSLEQFFINNANIEALDLSSNTSLTSFNATGNPNLFCILVDDIASINSNWVIDGQSFFSETCSQTYVPDDNFEQALIDLGYDNVMDDYVYTESINTITSLDLSGKSITNALGIEAFVALETLNMSTNFFSNAINFSALTQLKTLDISGNGSYGLSGETIDVSGCVLLESINISGNNMSNLNISNNINLEHFIADNNNLSVLNLSAHVNLTEIVVNNNTLAELNVKNGNNTNVTNFNATGNSGLDCITVDNASYSNTNWTNIDAASTFAETSCAVTYIPDDNFEQALIDLGIVSNTLIDDYVLTSEIENIEFLIIGGRSISDLTGIEDFTALKDLNVASNNLSNLDLSSNLALQSLQCNRNPLTALNISQNTVLTVLRAGETDLIAIDASNNIVLTSINVRDCANLSNLNLQNGNNTNMSGGNFTANNNPNLYCIQVDDAAYSATNWTTIDAHTTFSATDCNLTYVPDDGFEQRLINLGYDDILNDYVVTSNINTLTSIDLRFQSIVDITGIEGFTALRTLQCQVNDITTIDISNNLNLRTVYCDRNEITTLDVSTLTDLRLLRAYDNDLAAIDVSSNLLLGNLNVNDNPISSLDLTANTQLEKIQANNTSLETLDLNTNTILNEITVNDNASLSSFSIKNGNNAAVTIFNATGNTNLTCIEVDDAAATYLTSLHWVKDAETSFNEYCHYGETYVPDDNFEQVLIDLGHDDVLDDYVLTGNINAITSIDLQNKNISDATGIEDFIALEFLNFLENNLTTIDLSNNTSLEALGLGDNSLLALDVSNNLALTALYIPNNNINNIDVTLLVNLENLTATNNNLSSINVTNNPLLRVLNLSENALTALDVTVNSALIGLLVADNNLSSLNVKNGTNTQMNNSGNFNATGNPNLTCIQVDNAAWSTTRWQNIDAQTSFSEDCGSAITYTYNGSWFPSDPSGTSTAQDNIIVESGNAIISSNTSMNTAVVNPGGSLTVNSGVTLEVSEVTLESVSDSYSSLISDGVILGTVNYQRFVNSNSGGNDLISAPLSGQTWSSFLATDTNSTDLLSNGSNPTAYAFAPFDKSASNYVNFTSATITNLTSETGYRAATSSGTTLTFTGDVPTAPVPVNIINEGADYFEWNLIGNPFPSYINIQNFLDFEVDSGIKNIDLLEDLSGIYGYDGDTSDGWDVITLANAGSRLMAPGQAFFVAADPADVSLYDVVFDTSIRATGTSDDFILGRNNVALTYMKLNAITSNNNYNTEFYFNDNASLGLDLGYDAQLWGGSIPNFALYSHLVQDNTGEPIALQALNTTDLTDVTIPLGVYANQGEQLTFSISENELPVGTEVYLEDNLTNTFILLNSIDYTITPNEDLSGIGRFFLRFSNGSLSTNQNSLNAINIYADLDKQIVVIAGQLVEPTNAIIQNIQGQKVASKTLDISNNHQVIDVSNLSSGIYLVQLKNQTTLKTKKIIIK